MLQEPIYDPVTGELIMQPFDGDVNCWQPGMEWPACRDCGRPMELEPDARYFRCVDCPVLFQGRICEKRTRYEPA
jgi:DNA-directed RNA polymerase subunit RPC12/RpoP